MCLYTRELETRGSVKVRFLWMQFRPLYICLSTRVRPMTLHHPAKRDNLLKASPFFARITIICVISLFRDVTF